MGISLDELADQFPRLYHMAAVPSWPSIQRRGLLSTTAILDLFEVEEPRRSIIERSHRRDSILLLHETHGVAVIRDQKPMSDASLRKALLDGLAPEEWYAILNEKVFFWLSEARLKTMMNARAYRNQSKVVLVVETRTLLERHWDRVVLAPMNTGATIPFCKPMRGIDTFQHPDTFPFATRLKKRPDEPIVEFAVRGGVPDILEFVVSAKEIDPDGGSRDLLADLRHVATKTSKSQ